MSDTQMVLPIDKVVYYAQEVCVVIATERYIAADAIEKVGRLRSTPRRGRSSSTEDKVSPYGGRCRQTTSGIKVGDREDRRRLQGRTR
jgi:hypothetical protein